MRVSERIFALARETANAAIVSCFVSVLVTSAALAQSGSTDRSAVDTAAPTTTVRALGITASVAAVSHTVPPGGVNGVPNCCNTFDNRTSIGWDVALRYALPLSSARLFFSAGVSHVGVTTEVTQDIGRVLVNGVVVPAVVTNQLTLSNMIATVGIGVEVPLVSSLQAWAAVNAGIPLQQVFSQKETLNTPSAQFENGASDRNVILDADVGENSVMVMPSAGLRYSVKLGADWVVGPHVGVQFSPLSSSKRLESWTWLSGLFGVLIERSL